MVSWAYFHIKVFSKCNFLHALQLRLQHYSDRAAEVQKITPDLQQFLAVIYCRKCEKEFFEYYVLLLFFFRRSLARHGEK